MSRLTPLPAEDTAHLAEQFEGSRAVLGFVPNSMPTMARVPGLAEAFSGLGKAIYLGSGLPIPLLQMVAHVASSASGCRYCQAHTAASAHNMGVPEEKLAALWEWERNDLFDAAERAALDLALNAGSVPNTVTDEHFDTLRAHFTEDQIAGLVAVISMFGFLNRWNDTMATELEAEPTDFADRVLRPSGWNPGHHAAGNSN